MSGSAESLTSKNSARAPRLANVPCPLCGASAGIVKWRGRDRLMGVPGDFTVEECTKCGFYYQNPRPIPEDLYLCYPGDYPAYHPVGGEGHKLFRDGGAKADAHRYILAKDLGYSHLAPARAGIYVKLLAFLRAGKVKKLVYPMRGEGRMLDVGCSTGARMSSMKSLGWKVSGIEFSPEVAAVAAREHTNIFAGDILDATFPENSFELVTCFHVLEHVADPRAVITKMLRWLAPGGMLVIESPNAASVGAARFGTHWFLLDLPRHFHHFTPDSVTKMIQLCGGKVTKLEHEGSTGALAGSIQFQREDAGMPRLGEKLLKRKMKRVAWWGAVRGKGEILRVFVERR